MAEGVPIRVVIGLRKEPTGIFHDYPDWDTLALVPDAESHQLIKWMYDKRSGHDDEGSDSPVGQQFGMMIVTRAFADAALIAFPALVTELTLSQARRFYEDRVTAHLPENRIDIDELNGLTAKRNLFIAQSKTGFELSLLDAEIEQALDPRNRKPGVRRTEDKTWAELLKKHDVTMHASVS